MRIKKVKGLTYSETIRFHGHNGPFLALGYKLGKFIVNKLRPKGVMDLKITVQTRLEKPYTCLVDGLQCSTFATSGKNNIIIKKIKGKDIIVVVKKGKRKCEYKISEDAMKICLNAKDLSKAAKKIFKTSANKLWMQIR